MPGNTPRGAVGVPSGVDRWVLECVPQDPVPHVAPARLLAPACRMCGLPSLLDAILDCWAAWDGCPPGQSGPGCWHQPSDRPLTAAQAAR